jgi:multiple sugar transport system substrate-binding protein
MPDGMSRRKFLKMVNVAAGAGFLTLAGCTPAAQKPATGAQATQAPAKAAGAPVPALLRSGSGEEDYFKKAIDLFESKNPDVKINRVFAPGGDEYITKLDLMIASGDPPAIYAPFSSRGYRYYAAKGLSQELDGFVAADKMDLSDFHPDGLKGCHWQGKLMALPLDLWPHLMVYNKNLFKEAGIPDLPTDWNDTSWNMDKYLEIAKALTKPEKQQFGTTIYFNYWAAGWAFGGDWFPLDTYDTGIVADFTGDKDDKTIGAVQWNADLMNKEKVAPTPSQSQSMQAGLANLFMSNKIGMQIDNIGNLSTYAKITDFEWGVAAAPMPPAGAKRKLHVWIDFWSMIKGVKNLDGAWKFLKFMVSTEAQKIYPIEYGPQSALLSLGDEWLKIQRGLLPKMSDAEFKCMTDGPKLEVIDLENWTVNFSVINSKALQPALDTIWLGEKPAKDVITEAAPQIRQIIEDTKKIS